MTTHLSESQLSTFINSRIGKTGHLNNKKDTIHLELDPLFVNEIPPKNKWVQIHTGRVLSPSKSSYLQYLLENDTISNIPFRVFKITETVSTQRLGHNSSYDNAGYYINSQIEFISYQIYLVFESGMEYMINLHDKNQYMSLLYKPSLYSFYRVMMLSTGKYVFYVDREYLDKLVDVDSGVVADDILIEIIKHHQIQGHPEFNILNDTRIPYSINYPVEESIDLTLFQQNLKEPMIPHQLDNILWMIYLEKMSNLKMTQLNYVNTQGMIEFRLGKENYYTNHSYQRIYNRSGLTKTPRQETIFLRGGVLADEAGMGKTRSVLGLILVDYLDPGEMKTNVDLDLINTKYHFGTSEDNNPLSLTHFNHIKNNEEQPEDLNEDIDSFPSLIKTGRYRMGWSLIVAPSHVIDTWQEELSEMTTAPINYLILSNMTHVKRLTIEQIYKSHFIVLSSNLLANKKYHEYVRLQVELDFRNYYWRRVILDEADDILRLEMTHHIIDSRTSNIRDFIINLDGINKWCLSSTPFQYKESNLAGYLNFLGHCFNKDIIYNLEEEDIRKILRCYFRRHNKNKLLKQLKIPRVKETVIYLEQSGIEKAIYQSALRKYNKLRLMQLCTHIQISNEEIKMLGNFAGHQIMSLNDIEESMIKYYQNRIHKTEKDNMELQVMSKKDTEYRNKLVKHINNRYLANKEMNVTPLQMANSIKNSADIQYIYCLIDDYLNDYSYKQILSTLSNCSEAELWTVLHINHEIVIKHEERLANQTKENNQEVTTLKNQMGLFKQSYISESVKEPCFICYQQFDKVIITECRHIFCGNCMKLLFHNKKSIPCPLCRRHISSDDIKVTDIKLIKKEEKTDVKKEDIQKYGTKIAYLIQNLRGLLAKGDNRIIVCSQWGSMIELISDVLTEFKIQHFIFKGSLSNIRSKMAQFGQEDPDVRVLLLTPESCILGNDLTTATHIIMTDVLMMNKNDAKIIQNQLLGYIQRIGEDKEVEIIKLVIKGTIEEDYHQKQK